jgi:hypothetical protein
MTPGVRGDLKSVFLKQTIEKEEEKENIIRMTQVTADMGGRHIKLVFIYQVCLCSF